MEYLRNVKTGVVFLFHPLLAKNKDMEPYDMAHGGSDAETDGSVTTDSIIIEKASKAELIAFAAANYGVEIDRSVAVADVRAQVRELIEADA